MSPAFLRSWFVVLLAVVGGARQQALVNGDFEGDSIGDMPRGWYLPKPCADAGYGLEVTEASATGGGKRCVAISGTGGDSRIFGNCMQSLDAAPFRGKRLRFSAAVRCEPADGESRAQLWFRVDRPERQMGFFDNMDDRPIRAEEWQRYEIVGDIADDAEKIALGMMLIGGGTAWFDDVLLEVADVNVPTTGAGRIQGAPGLAVAAYAAKAHVNRDVESVSFRFPLPLAYRDQTPLTFRLLLEPAVEASVEITAGPGPNRVLELELRGVEQQTDLTLRYESVVLVSPTSFDAVPAKADFPAQWPAEASPWLAATWCCDSEDKRIKAIGAELRAGNADVKAVVNGVLRRSQEIFGQASGRVINLTAVEALDKQGSCTSCANLVAALLRAAGVPARILSGYPLWSGPLQTHYIVEAYVPGFGWYPVESTLGQAPWPNHQQINVSLVPIEHEAEEVAGRRGCAAGAVPFMTLTEHENDSPIFWQGTLKPACDHEGRLLRPIEADAAEWQRAHEWARGRWSKWLDSKPEIEDGELEFGPPSESLAAETIPELLSELR